MNKIEIFEQYVKRWKDEIFNLELLISTIESQIYSEKIIKNLNELKNKDNKHENN